MPTCNFKAQQNPCLPSQSEKNFPFRTVSAFDRHVHHSPRAQHFLLGMVIFPCPLWKVSSRRAGLFYHSTSTWHAGGSSPQVVSSIKCKKIIFSFFPHGDVVSITWNDICDSIFFTGNVLHKYFYYTFYILPQCLIYNSLHIVLCIQWAFNELCGLMVDGKKYPHPLSLPSCPPLKIVMAK